MIKIFTSLVIHDTLTLVMENGKDFVGRTKL